MDAALRLLLDREEILDCMVRYCRGVDRLDRELLLSAYHDDAVDDHGVAVMAPSDFAGWLLGMHREHQRLTRHAICNISYDIDGDVAHVESYIHYSAVNLSQPPILSYGRYADRFERREGRWAIAARVCRAETTWKLAEAAESHHPPYLRCGVGGHRDRQDRSYQRPLVMGAP